MRSACAHGPRRITTNARRVRYACIADMRAPTDAPPIRRRACRRREYCVRRRRALRIPSVHIARPRGAHRPVYYSVRTNRSKGELCRCAQKSRERTVCAQTEHTLRSVGMNRYPEGSADLRCPHGRHQLGYVRGGSVDGVVRAGRARSALCRCAPTSYGRA